MSQPHLLDVHGNIDRNCPCSGCEAVRWRKNAYEYDYTDSDRERYAKKVAYYKAKEKTVTPDPKWENMPKEGTPQNGDVRIHIEKALHWGWRWSIQQYHQVIGTHPISNKYYHSSDKYFEWTTQFRNNREWNWEQSVNRWSCTRAGALRRSEHILICRAQAKARRLAADKRKEEQKKARLALTADISISDLR